MEISGLKDFMIKPRIHRVYNRDNHEFRVMDIELTNKNYIVLDSPINMTGFYFFIRRKTGAGLPVNNERRQKDFLITAKRRYTDDHADGFRGYCPGK